MHDRPEETIGQQLSQFFYRRLKPAFMSNAEADARGATRVERSLDLLHGKPDWLLTEDVFACASYRFDLSSMLGMGRGEDDEIDGGVSENSSQIGREVHSIFLGKRPLLLAASDRLHDAKNVGADRLAQDVLAPPSQADDGCAFRAGSLCRQTHPFSSIT
jgi:hypothetical protein